MTAIQDHGPSSEGNSALEMGAAAMSVATAAVAAASQAVRSVTTQLAAHQTAPAWEIGQRVAALQSGNTTERELARFITRCLDVAEGTRPRANGDDDTPPDHGHGGTGPSGAGSGGAEATADASQATAGRSADEITGDAPGGYSTALSGVDAFETILSAAEAGKARVVTEAYAHAREALVEPTLSPGQRVKHTDGRIDTVLSSTQITGADLSVIVNQSPGLAKVNVTRAVNLVQRMPHTLARLEAGELSAYQQRLIVDEALPMPPALIEQLDELVCGRPFTGRHAGTGDHRAAMSVFRRRLNKAVEAIGFEPPAKKSRRSGFAGRYVRFGLTGADGMTSLHGCVPSLHAKAIDTLLEDLARLTHNDKIDERTVEQRRVDAFLTCFTGPAALSPAGQLAFDVSAASFDEDGQYVVVDEQQNLQAQSIWATIQLLAASLGLTFPDVPKATVTVDVDLDTLTDPPCSHGPYDHAAPPSSAPNAADADPADATAGTDATRETDAADATRGTDATGSTGVDEVGPPPAGPTEGPCLSSGAVSEPSCSPARLWAFAPPDRGSTPRGECGYSPPGSGAVPGSLSARAADAYWIAWANQSSAAQVLDRLRTQTTVGAHARPRGTTRRGAERRDHGVHRPSGRPCDGGDSPATPARQSVDTCCDPLLHDASPAGAGARHRPATVRGVGDIPDSLARRLMRFAGLRRVVSDPLTGQPLEVGRRHPDTKLRTAILNRDRHCRFPGCARTTGLDLDHITPYRDDAPATVSQTVPENLQALCREHHRVKHQLHWIPDMQPDGTIQWRNNLLDLTATS